MRATPLPLVREIVLVGGGHTHALVLRRWGMHPLPGARLTVINPGPTAPYTGMLPGYIAGHYPREALEIDLVRLARHAGARLILGRVEGMDLAAQQLHVSGRAPIEYGVASLNIGATSSMPALPGFGEHAVGAKPLDRLAEAWARFVANAPAHPRIVVIGAGVAGVELALAMAWRLQDRAPCVTLIDAGEALRGATERGRRLLKDQLGAARIDLIQNATVTTIGEGAVHLSDRQVASDFTVGAAGAQPYEWLAATGLHLTGGYVTVGPTLRTPGHPNVFAAGDCAHLSHAPRPKAGVYAVREAPILYANLRAVLTGFGRLRHYRAQQDYLRLISVGRQVAVAEKWGLAVAGPALWRWKDRIDRRFMDRLADLAPMPQPPLPRTHVAGMAEALGPKPLCGGCGAKVGGDPLAEALGGIGDDAAVLRTGGALQVVSTDHLRAVTEDPWVMARIAAHHALGDIWAMGARPQAALATVILPRMTEAMQRAWLAEIMRAAREVFATEGAEVVGGHTSLGAELTIGFTVTGLCDNAPITLAGARPGDALLLTKPLGIGTILAAEMQLAARGPWVAACIAAMQQPQGAAARLLSHAHAMTDVTGFGLAGHLANIARASQVGVEVELAEVPFLPGATELSTAGTRSTLFEANLRHAFDVPASCDAREALLYDPQTAGGLLAAISEETLKSTLSGLHNTGFTAARIGTVLEGPPSLRVR